MGLSLRGSEAVQHAYVGDAFLLVFRECFVRRVRAGELRVPTRGVDLARGEQGGPLRDLVGGAVDVPQEVALAIPSEHSVRLGRVQRDRRDLGKFVLTRRVRHDLTEQPAERHQVGVADIDFPVDDDAVLVESGEACVGGGLIDQVAALKAGDFDSDGGREGGGVHQDPNSR